MFCKKGIALALAGPMMAGLLAGAGSFCVMAAQEISEEQAKEIALSDAGLTEKEVTFDSTKKGSEQGAAVYEIEFKTSEIDYDYDIALADGEIIQMGWEMLLPVAQGPRISEEDAKQKALEEAKVKEEEVTFTKIESGFEDGIESYDIDFETQAEELSCEIALEGGLILGASRKVKTPASLTAQKKTDAPSQTAKTGKDGAIEAALSHAGFTAQDVSALKCEKEQDDGREIYEIEFLMDGYEYSYEINAEDYSILEWEKERDD